MKATNHTIVMMVICVLFWGGMFPSAKYVLGSVSGLSLVIYRFIIAVISLCIYMKLKRMRIPSLTASQWLILIITGAIGTGGFNLAMFNGLKQSSSTNGALIMALSPIMTSLLTALIERKWLDRKQTFSLVIAFCGVALVITNGSIARLIQLDFNQGDILLVCAMLMWSGYTVCSHKWNQGLAAVPYTQVTLSAGAVVSILYGLTQTDYHFWQETRLLSTTAIFAVFYVGLFATVLGYLFWIKGAMILGSAKSSLFFNLVPVFAALISFLLGQDVTQIQITGMVVVLVGLTVPLWLNPLNRLGKLLVAR